MKTIDDVRAFFEELKQQGVNFHPDDNFNDYVDVETGQSSFSAAQAAELNDKLDQAFEVCAPYGENKIYELAIEVFHSAWLSPNEMRVFSNQICNF